MSETQNTPSRRLVIAVDGPAASGKGTLAGRLATHFGLPHLDTGSLYRAVAKKTLLAKQSHGEHAIAPYEAAHPEHPDTLLAVQMAQQLTAEDLAHADLGSETIGQIASLISSIPGVRTALLEYQRQFAAQGNGAVLDGRDIGTVICPDATVKFYISASAEVRAERRYRQQTHEDDAVSYETILGAIHSRDQRDSSRATAPMKQAEDAIHLDTSAMTADEVFEKALEFIVSPPKHALSHNCHSTD